MGYRSPFIVLAAGAWLALGVVTGCNAVLGIEEATPRQGNGIVADVVPSSAKRYTGGNICTADVPDLCTQCLVSAASDTSTSCQAEVAACLGARACRRKFDDYSACLHKSCQPNTGECFEPLFDPGAGTPNCITEHCFSACSKAQVVSQCQLYCACMNDNCSEKFPSMAACLSTCSGLDADTVTCRRTHCEIAADDPGFGHCDHAVGIANCVTTPNRAQECADKSLLTFACTDDSECCSNNCNTKLKACAPP